MAILEELMIVLQQAYFVFTLNDLFRLQQELESTLLVQLGAVFEGKFCK